MRISLKWLSEYVEVPAPEELARRLTAVGLEVEAIERTGQGLSGVVAARVLTSGKHPDAEKLSVTTVDRGDGAPLQIVCGARNYRVGDLVPLATVGTTLPGGTKIEKARLRGVESFGMLCSARELGLAEDASGLLILPPEVKPGTPIGEALGLEDVLLEVNVTPNRPDALSHLGLAREVAAILGAPLKHPGAAPREAGAPASGMVAVRIDAPEKCARYAARVVEGVRIGPSPLWLQRRLESCGVRAISNVVDATNFVLLEMGHPLHAFDLDRVAGAQIVVRTARPGESLTTLDGKARALDPDDLLICDRDRASALAGTMGGGDSEISDGTTRVLLESAWFEPGTVRRTAKRHGLHTEASHRFERGADPAAVLPALDRCAALIAELSGGTVRPGVVDCHPRPATPRAVRLRWRRPAEVLGLEVTQPDVRRILGGLGFAERGADASAEAATWLVPSWRVDVSIEEDLVEELIRTIGYQAIPETLPRLALDSPGVSPRLEAEARTRAALEAAGFREVVSYAFVPPGDLQAFHPGVLPVALVNPISADMAVMRTSLVPSLLRTAAHNRRQGVEAARLYEVASTFAPRDAEHRDPPALERAVVSLVQVGRRSPLTWATGGEAADFYDLKATVEGVLKALGVDASFEPAGRSVGWLHPRASARLVGSGGAALGVLGEVHPRVAAAFELPRGVLAAELDAAALLAAARLVPSYRPIPRLPAVLRDLAVVVDEAVAAAAVAGLVREEPLVEDVTLFDVYRGAPLPAGKKNLALAIRYRAADRTLTDAEADAAHGAIVKRLAERVGAELRG
jgi:phenylalanyl-tRNA synthetase beta chain